MFVFLDPTIYTALRSEPPRMQTMEVDSRLNECMATLRRNAEKNVLGQKAYTKDVFCGSLVFGLVTIPPAWAYAPFALIPIIGVTASCWINGPKISKDIFKLEKNEWRLKLMSDCRTPEQQRELALTYINKTELFSAVYLADNITHPRIQSSVYLDISLFLMKNVESAESVTYLVRVVQKIQDLEVKKRAIDSIFDEFGLHFKGIQDLVREIRVTSPISIETAVADIGTCPRHDRAIRSIITGVCSEATLTPAEKQMLLKRIGGPFITELMPLLV